MNLILIVGTDGSNIGMRKNATPIFGTLVPNYLGNDMRLITAAYSDGTDFILQPDDGEQIDGAAEFKLASESGASATLSWSALNGYYSGPVDTLGPVLDSHLDGVLNLQLDQTALTQKEKTPKKRSRKKKTVEAE